MATATQDQHWVNVTATFNDGSTPPRPATIDTSDHQPDVASSDPTIVSVANVAVAADNKSVTFDIETIGVGTARVTVSADANMANGTVNDIVLTSEDLVVTAGQAGQATGGNIALQPAVNK